MWIKIFMLQIRMGANVFTCSRQRTKISRCTWWVSSFSRPPTSRETCNAWLYTSVLYSSTWHMNTYNPYKLRSTNRHIFNSQYAEHFWNNGTNIGVCTMHKIKQFYINTGPWMLCFKLWTFFKEKRQVSVAARPTLQSSVHKTPHSSCLNLTLFSTPCYTCWCDKHGMQICIHRNVW